MDASADNSSPTTDRNSRSALTFVTMVLLLLFDSVLFTWQ